MIYSYSRAPVGKRGLQHQKDGPSDYSPVIGFREEADREAEAQGPNCAGNPEPQHDEMAGLQASKQANRQAGTQASNQAGKQAGR